ncbi:MAG: SDR family oxidoreductase [Chitinophagales bacterium]
MILITGATGHLGAATIEHLLKKITADKIVAFARNAEKAAALKAKGIKVHIGTFDDTDSLDRAMQGIEKVLLVSGSDANRLEQHKNVVNAAKKAGVQHIAYTSLTLKDINTSAVKLFMESHFQTEDYIKESGLTYTFLRNTLYLDGIPLFTGEHVLETGIFLPCGNGKVGFALRREMAEAAANVLLQNTHNNKTYAITGNELYSYEDVAAALSDLSGKTVQYTNIDATVFTEQLKQLGIPQELVHLLAGIAAYIKNTQLEVASNDLEQLIGRTPATLKDGLKEQFNL